MNALQLWVSLADVLCVVVTCVLMVRYVTARLRPVGTIEKANEAIAGMRHQVDVVLSQVLELNRKSQHIAAVADIVNELSERTNIAAINATIEAAGAGDAGKRFAAVAEEIRELADRMQGSSKQIRGMIEAENRQFAGLVEQLSKELTAMTQAAA